MLEHADADTVPYDPRRSETIRIAVWGAAV
jgi:hypothetical protein